MKETMRNFIYQLLPKRVQEMRKTYLIGNMSRGGVAEEFLYDRNILKKLRKEEAFSQFGQDIFIYYIVFGGRKGTFLDIGGNDPIKINNTYLLEQKGWRGVAFEPIRSLAEKWKNERLTPCYNIAIGNFNGEVIFDELQNHEFSKVNTQTDKVEGTAYRVKQKTLSTVIREEKMNIIDVIFIDVEGYEMDVLKGIDFESVRITCFCIENNRHSDIVPGMEIREFLLNRGYKLIARLTIDDVYIKEEYLDDILDRSSAI